MIMFNFLKDKIEWIENLKTKSTTRIGAAVVLGAYGDVF